MDNAAVAHDYLLAPVKSQNSRAQEADVQSCPSRYLRLPVRALLCTLWKLVLKIIFYARSLTGVFYFLGEFGFTFSPEYAIINYVCIFLQNFTLQRFYFEKTFDFSEGL